MKHPGELFCLKKVLSKIMQNFQENSSADVAFSENMTKRER